MTDYKEGLKTSGKVVTILLASPFIAVVVVVGGVCFLIGGTAYETYKGSKYVFRKMGELTKDEPVSTYKTNHSNTFFDNKKHHQVRPKSQHLSSKKYRHI